MEPSELFEHITDKNFKYVARDEDGEICLFYHRPEYCVDSWVAYEEDVTQSLGNVINIDFGTNDPSKCIARRGEDLEGLYQSAYTIFVREEDSLSGVKEVVEYLDKYYRRKYNDE